MKTVRIFIALLLMCAFGLAKDSKQKNIVMNWPSDQKLVVRFTIGTLTKIGSYSGESSLQADVVAENLWDKRIENASFSLFLFDKQNVRIGDGWIQLSHMAPGEVVKFKLSLHSSGNPASMRLEALDLPTELQVFAPPKLVSVNVYSVPSGADFKIDGKPAGVTPKEVQLSTGRHQLEFSKDGFRPGTYPFEVTRSTLPGGSITFELGTAAGDTLELRDGTLLIGDLESMSATEVIFRVGGSEQKVDRNKVKRILLVQREAPTPASK